MRLGDTICCITSNKRVMTCGGRDHLEKVAPDIISPCPVLVFLVTPSIVVNNTQGVVSSRSNTFIGETKYWHHYPSFFICQMTVFAKGLPLLSAGVASHNCFWPRRPTSRCFFVAIPHVQFHLCFSIFLHLLLGKIEFVCLL